MQVIPFNRPLILENGYRYIRQAVENKHLSGDGPFTKRTNAMQTAIISLRKSRRDLGEARRSCVPSQMDVLSRTSAA